MRPVPLRRLVAGPPPGPERVFFTSLWFKGHNNPRYAELLPRLSRLDGYLFTASETRMVRGLQYRAFRWSSRVRNPALFTLANRRYRTMFTADNEQISHFIGPVVSDVDDPLFRPREVELLQRPNLAAYVVTADRAGRRFQELGVEKPYHVIPQGISLSSLRDDLIAQAASGRRPGEIVVGWMAAFLLSREDRGGESSLYNAEHLLELWDEIHARLPHGRLWLVGAASERIRERVEGRDDIVLFGRLPREQALATAASFDIALYPRTEDKGIQAAKVGEFIGLGVPTVSYDYEVTENLRETGAGLLVPTPREFVDAVVHLGKDEAARRQLASAARRAGAELDWDVLARRYEELLDRYLPGRFSDGGDRGPVRE
ncbi:MAG: glycosyltransferase family 4 protein [Actinobacteria bacterium]|nr:glycosyltransferase family 4 protein [Actinomycetota bacterium]